MSSVGWIVVETFSDTIGVIGVDGRPKQRTSLLRTLSEGASGRIARTVMEAVEGEIAAWKNSPAEANETLHRVDVGDAATQLIARPLLGPGPDLFGAMIWVGRVGDSPRPPRGVLPFTWNSGHRLVELPPQLPDAFTRGSRYDGRRTLTAPEAFRLFEIDNSFDLIRKVLGREPKSFWSGLVKLRRVDASRASMHLAMVSGDASEPELWRGIIHEVSVPSTGTWESLESATLAAIPTLSGDSYFALVDIKKMRLIRWITDPLPDIQWKGMVDDRDTPHPEDVPRIFAVAADLFAGKKDHGGVSGVRLRRFGGGWTVVDGEGALVRSPDGAGPQLGLIQLKIVGETNDPDPVPVTDTGHPGLG